MFFKTYEDYKSWQYAISKATKQTFRFCLSGLIYRWLITIVSYIAIVQHVISTNPEYHDASLEVVKNNILPTITIDNGVMSLLRLLIFCIAFIYIAFLSNSKHPFIDSLNFTIGLFGSIHNILFLVCFAVLIWSITHIYFILRFKSKEKAAQEYALFNEAFSTYNRCVPAKNDPILQDSLAGYKHIIKHELDNYEPYTDHLNITDKKPAPRYKRTQDYRR